MKDPSVRSGVGRNKRRTVARRHLIALNAADNLVGTFPVVLGEIVGEVVPFRLRSDMDVALLPGGMTGMHAAVERCGGEIHEIRFAIFEGK